MQIQAENIRAYSEAYAWWHDPIYLSTAKKITGYLKSFLLSPEGAFYASQDADLVPGQHSAGYFELSDTERRKLGIPRIDQHVYARENGWAINALVVLSTVSDDQHLLADAIRAAEWIIAHRGMPDGGYRHDELELCNGASDGTAFGQRGRWRVGDADDRVAGLTTPRTGDHLREDWRENDRGIDVCAVGAEGIS